MASVLADAPFQQHTITYHGATAWETDPETGNKVPITKAHTVTATVSVDRSRARQLQAQEGADLELIPVKIELITPLTLPTSHQVGSELHLKWLGENMVATITGIIPNDLIGVDFGQVILADLTKEAPK